MGRVWPLRTELLTAAGWLPALELEHGTVYELKAHFPTLWDFPYDLFSAKQRYYCK